MSQITTKTKNDKYGIEFFHIYTDEEINDRHITSIQYLKTLMKSWSFPFELIVLIDNYNPINHIIDKDEVFSYIKDQDINLSYWAYEKDMIKNAELLLASITNNRLLKGYRNYIAKNNKYPCSLLTATWYLTRLGYIEPGNAIKSISEDKVFQSSSRLFNILPEDYKIIEAKAKTLISNSSHAEAVDKIQNFYYLSDGSRVEDLF